MSVVSSMDGLTGSVDGWSTDTWHFCAADSWDVQGLVSVPLPNAVAARTEAGLGDVGARCAAAGWVDAVVHANTRDGHACDSTGAMFWV